MPALPDAVAGLVRDGMTVGIGGQNIGRCAVATAHEIIRQGRRDLVLAGCNLSVHADLLIAAGCVRRCECGTGNLETYGVTPAFRRAVEERRIGIADWDHLSMLARFVAGGLGIPFLPVMHLAGSDLLPPLDVRAIADPFHPPATVFVVPALRPDVAIVHAIAADASGNVLIEGPASHDPELLRAARTSIVTVDRLLDGTRFDHRTPGTVIPRAFVSAVVHCPGGAWPTASPGAHPHDDAHLRLYQEAARAGGPSLDRYLQTFVRDCRDHAAFLARAGAILDGSSG